jgi:hypothetical protein
MYDIEYFIDIRNPIYLRIKSNYLPEIPSAVTINGTNYKVTNVKHVLNTNPDPYQNDTVEEKFIVTVTEMTEEEHEALRAKRKSSIL